MQKFDPAGHVGNLVVEGLVVGSEMNWPGAICGGGFFGTH